MKGVFFFLNKQRQNYRIWIQGFQFFWKICKMWKGLKRTRECFSTLLLEVNHRYECISNWFKKKRPGNRIATSLCTRVHTDRCCSCGRSARLTWWTFAESYQSRSQCRLMAASYRAGVGKVREDVSGCNLLISAGEIAGQNRPRGRETLPSGPWSAVPPSMRSAVELCQSARQAWAQAHRTVLLGPLCIGISAIKSFRQHNEACDMFQQIWAEWRGLTGDLSSLATLYGAATRPDRKIPPLSMYASSFLGPIAYCRVTQTSASAVLLKQQHLLVSRWMWHICFGSLQSRCIYRFAISECNLSKWGCDLFAVICSRLKGHISGQKQRLKRSTSLHDPLKSIQGMKTLLSPLRLRDQFSFIQRSSENCNLKFVNVESWARRQMRIIFSFSKDTAETE